jgi:hypothetical protein
MRHNYGLVYRSSSMQGPHEVDYLFPRAILSSMKAPESEKMPPSRLKGLFLTFNGKHSQAGHDRLEILDVDFARPRDKALELREIIIPEIPPTEKRQRSWQDIQTSIRFSDANPSTCRECHGQRVRPIFSSYPFWTGVFGSSEVELPVDEAEGFTKFLRQHISNPESRYFNLVNSPKNINSLNSIKKNSPSVQAQDVRHLRLAFAIHQDVTDVNMNRVAWDITEGPDYARFRYAIAGALLSCLDSSSFLPPNLLHTLSENVLRRSSIQPISKKQIRTAFTDGFQKYFESGFDTQFGSFPRSQPTVNATILAHLKTLGPQNNMLQIWIDTFQKQGAHRPTLASTMLRVVFEGRGLSMSDWAPDLRLGTYRLHQGVGPAELLLRLLDRDEVLAEMFRRHRSDVGTILSYDSQSPAPQCESLKQKSLQNLKDFSLKPITKPIAKDVSQKFRTDSLSGSLAGKLPSAFTSVCIRCHMQLPVGPGIPFHNEAQMKDYLKIPGNIDELYSRVFDKLDLGAMPPTRELSEKELSEIKAYLDGLK